MKVPFHIMRGQLPDIGERRFFTMGDSAIVVFNVDGELYAIEDRCPHQGASLFSGKIEECLIQCPAHGLKFNLKDGCMPNSSMLKINTYPIEIYEEHIVIMLEQGVEA